MRNSVPSTVNAASVTLSEKEIVEAKDVLWETCKSNLDVDKPIRRVASVNRTEKMAHLTDIVEASSELMSKNKKPDASPTQLVWRGGQFSTMLWSVLLTMPKCIRS